MQSLRELYKTGRGPSSSHTMGPERAANLMKSRYKDADKFVVTLYGSLASTGKGHNTDDVLKKTFAPTECEVAFDFETPCPVHPNTLDIAAMKEGERIALTRFYSVGGGTIKIEGEPDANTGIDNAVYALSTYDDISAYCQNRNIRLWQYVVQCEGEGILGYLQDIWTSMQSAIHDGLTTSGVLPGCLGTQRRAQKLYNQRHIDESAQTRENRLVCSYAFAVSEQNSHRAHLRQLRRCAQRFEVYAAIARVQRRADSARACHRRADRQHNKDKRFDIGRRVRLPGRNRFCLLDGGGCAGRTVRNGAGTDRVCG